MFVKCLGVLGFDSDFLLFNCESWTKGGVFLLFRHTNVFVFVFVIHNINFFYGLEFFTYYIERSSEPFINDTIH